MILVNISVNIGVCTVVHIKVKDSNLKFVHFKKKHDILKSLYFINFIIYILKSLIICIYINVYKLRVGKIFFF